MTDWIQRIKANQNEALREIYSQYKHECLRWLEREFNLDPEEAIDVFQMSVIIMYDNIIIGKLTSLSSGIGTYLHGIARNKALEVLRQKKKVISNEKQDIILLMLADEPEVQDQEENIRLAVRSLEDLGDPCKTLLTHFYYHQKSIDEITALMDYKNSDTTKNLKYKCLRRLQKSFFSHNQ